MSDKTLTTEHTELTKTRKELNELTEIVTGCAIEGHRSLGPGLLESTHEMCLCRELNFNVRMLTHGVRRKILGPPEEVSL
jgi:PD-(D/E)XK nuclease superfamily